MTSVSKALGTGTVKKYYRADYSAAINSSYYSESQVLKGDWHGRIAEVFGLQGQQVHSEHFDRLAEGQHPITGEQLIKHRDTALTEAGKESSHRAAWDIVFSPAKSVSVTALVGGDERIVVAHRNAVREALGQMEALIQARGGGNRAPITTGKMIAATFDHDTARPVDGYAAAQLHTHAVIFNMTEGHDGQARSLQPSELYVAQSMISAVYQNFLEAELRKLGYVLERGKNHSVEISGYTPEYLASESLRSQQIKEAVEAKGFNGAESREVAAHNTRDTKQRMTQEDVRRSHKENAAKFGNQPEQIVAAARERDREWRREPDGLAKQAVDFARDTLSERNAVFDHHQVVTAALRYSRGRVTVSAIQSEIAARVAAGHFVAVHHVRSAAPLYRYTTPELIRDERAVIEAVRSTETVAPIARYVHEALHARYPHLNEWQLRVVRESLSSENRMTGIQGSAGTGKTSSLKVIRELSEESGWKVYGLAPTSGAARSLRQAGVSQSETLQRFLIRPRETGAHRRLFFLDESSLTAARQMRKFMALVNPTDRVIIVGDRRQHDSVEAGRIFEELQIAGMETARINKLVRQQDPGLKEVVKAMAQGRTHDGVDLLEQQGRVVVVPHRGHRLEAIAACYVERPEGTLVISPDNASREELNDVIRRQLRSAGKIGEDSYRMAVLVPRGNATVADLRLSSAYSTGDVLKYLKGSTVLGIKAQAYGTVLETDREKNTVQVKLDGGKTITYDPGKISGVSVYEAHARPFAAGERLQFTAPIRAHAVSNRDMGTLVKIDSSGNARVKLDDGRTVGISLGKNKHVEHGYVTTSHSAQGATVDRVLVHVDTGDSRIRPLINRTLAYVALSRPRFEARVFTDDRERLGQSLMRSQENTTALSHDQMQEYRTPKGKGRAA